MRLVVIPNYIVLSCEDCNGASGKSNTVAQGEFIETLIKRNETKLFVDGLPNKIKIDMVESRGRKSDLGENIKMLVGRCLADGFDKWEPK